MRRTEGGLATVAAYWAVIGDIVRSRAIAERAAFQARLEAVLEGANRLQADALASAWTVTLGDEFQALFHAPDAIPLALEGICHGLAGRGVRFGVGHGPLATPLKARAVGMDGPCFHRARAAIEAARRQRRCIVVETEAGAAERVSDVWNLALTVIRGRTARQAELVDAYRDCGSQARAAERTGVTQGTVSSELARARFAEVEAVAAHLPRMLTEAADGGSAPPPGSERRGSQ